MKPKPSSTLGSAKGANEPLWRHWRTVTDPFDNLKSALEDRYTIEREIGRGGMATVFLAEDVRHSRKPGWYRFGIFYDHFVREEYEEALAVVQAINMPGYYPTHGAIASTAGLLGRTEVAREAARELLAVYPAFAERGRAEYAKWTPDESVLDRYFLGLRAAGLEVADSGLEPLDAAGAV